MNPEFERNVWMELTPRRIVMMVALLGLTLFAASVAGQEDLPGQVALFLYFVIVVLWGTRTAALSVVGEIRDRTWDGQRLSALGAGTMTWGKLFGATIYNWLGGAICLLVIVLDILSREGPRSAAIQLFYYVGIGVIAQAAALLASLVAIARRQRHTRFETFFYQLVGLLAALEASWVWNAANPIAPTLTRQLFETVPWWGMQIDAQVFLLSSLALFSAWTLIGCYREMRVELKLPNGSLVWLAFLVFMGVYVAGFDGWAAAGVKDWNGVAVRLALAAMTFASLTYVMVVLEPKDRVHYRWMMEQFRRGRLIKLFSGLQAWMMSYFATLATAGALCIWFLHDPDAQRVGQPLVLATLGFLTRDVAIFVLMQTLPGKRRGDWAAIGILFALYALAPFILRSMHAEQALFLFHPQLPEPSWTGVIAAWTEGVLVAGLAFARLALPQRERKTA